MFNKKLHVDWKTVAAERRMRVPVTQLVKKYGCSSASIYLHTLGDGTLRRERIKEGKGKRIQFVEGARKPSNINGMTFAGALEQLRAKRDAITAAIGQLEEIGLTLEQ